MKQRAISREPMAPPRPKAAPISAAITRPPSRRMTPAHYALMAVVCLIKYTIIGLVLLRHAGWLK